MYDTFLHNQFFVETGQSILFERIAVYQKKVPGHGRTLHSSCSMSFPEQS